MTRLEDCHSWALALGWFLRRHQGLGAAVVALAVELPRAGQVKIDPA